MSKVKTIVLTGLLLGLTAIQFVSCESSSSSDSSTTTTTVPSASTTTTTVPAVSLTGTWTGTETPSGGSANAITLNLTQSGSSVSGTFTEAAPGTVPTGSVSGYAFSIHILSSTGWFQDWNGTIDATGNH